MEQFLTARAILEAIKLLGSFTLLSALPLLMVMMIKKNSWQHPIIRQLNNCIRHGTNFSERDCQKIELQLQEVRNRFDLLKGESLPALQKATPLNIAFQSLPLLEYMAKANTCCALHIGNIPPFSRTFACKQKLEELLSQWAEDEQLPFVSKEIMQIQEISERIERRKGNYRLRVFITLAVFLTSSFLIANLITLENPAWKTRISAYLLSLFVFGFSYDYYYSQKFRRYQTHWLIRFIKKVGWWK